MSDIHVLDRSGRGDLTVVYHIPVPDADNEVGISYRAALIASGMGGSTRLPDGDGTAGTISAAERAAIEAGEVVERSASIPFAKLRDAPGANPREAAMNLVRRVYDHTRDQVQAAAQSRLAYYGLTAAREV